MRENLILLPHNVLTRGHLPQLWVEFYNHRTPVPPVVAVALACSLRPWGAIVPPRCRTTCEPGTSGVAAGNARAAVKASNRTVDSYAGPRVRSARCKAGPRSARTVESTVDHGHAVGKVSTAVKQDRVATPSHSPVTPSPAPVRKSRNADANSEADRQSAPDNPRRRSPVKARKHREPVRRKPPTGYRPEHRPPQGWLGQS